MADIAYYVDYLGGHALYPNTRHITFCIRDHSFDIPELNINVSFNDILEIFNVDAEKLSTLRVLALGAVGALWRKKERYLVIRFHDSVQVQSVVLRCGHILSELQQDLFSRYSLHRQSLPTPPPPPSGKQSPPPLSSNTEAGLPPPP